MYYLYATGSHRFSISLCAHPPTAPSLPVPRLPAMSSALLTRQPAVGPSLLLRARRATRRSTGKGVRSAASDVAKSKNGEGEKASAATPAAVSKPRVAVVGAGWEACTLKPTFQTLNLEP